MNDLYRFLGLILTCVVIYYIFPYLACLLLVLLIVGVGYFLWINYKAKKNAANYQTYSSYRQYQSGNSQNKDSEVIDAEYTEREIK